MSDNMKKADWKTIESFEDLQKRKQELKDEIRETEMRVTANAKHILVEGAKVAAAGFAALLISKLIGSILKARKKAEQETPADEDQKPPRETPTEQETSSGEENGSSYSSAETALMWLKAISTGLDTARVLLHEFAALMNEDRGRDEEE